MVDIGDWAVKGKGNMRLYRVRAAAPGLRARGAGEGGADEQDRAAAGGGMGGLRKRGARRGAMTRQDEDETGLVAVHARVAAARAALQLAHNGGRTGAASVSSVDSSSTRGGSVYSRKGGGSRFPPKVGGGAGGGEASGVEGPPGVAGAFTSSTMLDAFESFSASVVMRSPPDTCESAPQSEVLLARNSLPPLVRQKALQQEDPFRINRTWLHFLDPEKQVLDDVATRLLH